VVKFRVDRIAASKATDIDAVSIPEDFDMAAFVKSMFRMYDGEITDVTFKCENALMNVIIDRFGEDVQAAITDTEHFYATANVSVSKTFFRLGGRFFDNLVFIYTSAKKTTSYAAENKNLQIQTNLFLIE